MYYATVSIPKDVLQAQRATAQAAPGKMGEYVTTVVKPRVETLVQQHLAPYPGPVSRPFVFGTDRSRHYYFASHKGKLPYRRNFDLAKAWRVDIDRRRNAGAIAVRNTSPAAIYVIGAWQVEGHRRTGWGKGFPEAIETISDEATDLMIDGWHTITGVR